jgi:hypothetical protein
MHHALSQEWGEIERENMTYMWSTRMQMLNVSVRVFRACQICEMWTRMLAKTCMIIYIGKVFYKCPNVDVHECSNTQLHT